MLAIVRANFQRRTGIGHERYEDEQADGRAERRADGERTVERRRRIALSPSPFFPNRNNAAAVVAVASSALKSLPRFSCAPAPNQPRTDRHIQCRRGDSCMRA